MIPEDEGVLLAHYMRMIHERAVNDYQKSEEVPRC